MAISRRKRSPVNQRLRAQLGTYAHTLVHTHDSRTPPAKVMTDLRTQLQANLGDGYTLERELGGGGMSRVFVAHENSLGRGVVVKVIAPELAEGVSAERFAR